MIGLNNGASGYLIWLLGSLGEWLLGRAPTAACTAVSKNYELQFSFRVSQVIFQKEMKDLHAPSHPSSDRGSEKQPMPGTGV